MITGSVLKICLRFFLQTNRKRVVSESIRSTKADKHYSICRVSSSCSSEDFGSPASPTPKIWRVF